MRVIATEKGFYGEKIRPEGEEFNIKRKTELGKWMKEVVKEEPKEEGSEEG